MSIDPKASYYDVGGIETIDIIRAKLTPEQFTGYLLGNIIKYSCRLPHRGQVERDAEKLEVYSRLLSERFHEVVAVPGTEPGRGDLMWPDNGDLIYCDNCPSDMEPPSYDVNGPPHPITVLGGKDISGDS